MGLREGRRFGVRLSGYVRSRRKRVFDLAVAAAVLPMVLVMMTIIGMLIWMREGRPILFVQQRSGKNGGSFNMVKFRTLRVESEAYAVSPRRSDDERITGVGRRLRGRGLDELPQIINVLRGEMSLVGPRPELPGIAAGYSEQEARRLEVTPGVSGLWQLYGDRDRAIHEEMKYDLYYLRRAKMWLDVKILAATGLLMVRGKRGRRSHEDRVHRDDLSEPN
jgi:putative colanic acid biosysnthesis UDP-glucose lipid carrier transferase